VSDTLCSRRWRQDAAAVATLQGSAHHPPWDGRTTDRIALSLDGTVLGVLGSAGRQPKQSERFTRWPVRSCTWLNRDLARTEADAVSLGNELSVWRVAAASHRRGERVDQTTSGRVRDVWSRLSARVAATNQRETGSPSSAHFLS
jgi:hypothetical protein